MKIVFATNNQHKLEEIRQILGTKFEVLSHNDIGCHDNIPEDHGLAVFSTRSGVLRASVYRDASGPHH